ncbi:MAG: MmcQ/YjbR family DNA-binding protein [Treponema sp.]|nr:MmcQ/YjbR family DNA-binding protein [Treponema sp.]
MTYNYLFSTYLPEPALFESFGFTPVTPAAGENALDTDKLYLCRKALSQKDFYVDFTLNLSMNTFEAHVFDSSTNEPYVLFDVENASGAFVGKIREEVGKIIDDFCHLCCKSADLKNDYVSFLEKNFAAKPEYPWDDSPDYGVFRCPNNKWFALMMKITYKQLLKGVKDGEFTHAEEKVWVVNIKADQNKIPSLIDNKSIFPAYHMNKKHWVTVVLTAVTDFSKLCQLTGESYELVMKKGK